MVYNQCSRNLFNLSRCNNFYRITLFEELNFFNKVFDVNNAKWNMCAICRSFQDSRGAAYAN